MCSICTAFYEMGWGYFMVRDWVYEEEDIAYFKLLSPSIRLWRLRITMSPTPRQTCGRPAEIWKRKPFPKKSENGYRLWAILIIRWLCSVTSWPPAIPASPLFSPCPWRITLWLLNYHVTHLPPMVVLEEYPLRTGRLLASGEPISKFGFDLGFVLNSFSYKVRRWLAGSRLPAIASRWG
jgi:hypothetical protein